MSWKQIRDKAQRDVHEKLKLSAICYLADGTSTPVSCRIHNAVETVGDLPQTGIDFPERIETSPTLIFLTSEHTPARGNIYSFGAGDGVYLCELVEDTIGITISAECKRLPDSDLADYPGP